LIYQLNTGPNKKRRSAFQKKEFVKHKKHCKFQTSTIKPAMNIHELYTDLNEAFANDNLNRITQKLIVLYKSRNFSKIRTLANKVSEYTLIDEESDAKCFSKLIQLYHPDKGELFRKQLQDLYKQNDFESLKNYSHIFLMANIDTISSIASIDKNVDYHPEYTYDANENDGFSYEDDYGENETDNEYETEDFERSFYNMIKMREYGTVAVEFPSYYLEDFEDFEMAESELESLDGIEHCIHIKILDVSDNLLTDISNLWDLIQLEELYLANNQIGYIDTLSNLINLKVLDISNNQIDDITPLLKLEHLEYVNLVGNKIPYSQIELLSQKGAVVIS